MDFIKKNVVFCVLIIICLLASATGAFLAFAEAGKVKSAQTKIDSAEAQLKNLLVANPSPTVENVAASEQNAAALTQELQKIRESLQRGSRISASSDGVRVAASLQQYITDYKRRVENNKDAEGADAPISVTDKFGFGFENVAYIGDDINDVDILSRAGLSAAPADAVPSAKKAAKIILQKKGGEGCIREFIENYIIAID